jgi:hypothetical protein
MLLPDALPGGLPGGVSVISSCARGVMPDALPDGAMPHAEAQMVSFEWHQVYL